MTNFLENFGFRQFRIISVRPNWNDTLVVSNASKQTRIPWIPWWIYSTDVSRPRASGTLRCWCTKHKGGPTSRRRPCPWGCCTRWSAPPWWPRWWPLALELLRPWQWSVLTEPTGYLQLGEKSYRYPNLEKGSREGDTTSGGGWPSSERRCCQLLQVSQRPLIHYSLVCRHESSKVNGKFKESHLEDRVRVGVQASELRGTFLRTVASLGLALLGLCLLCPCACMGLLQKVLVRVHIV